MYKFYEFFAGGGFARLGLGELWECLFANDISAKKVRAYQTNFPPAIELVQEDVYNLSTSQLPEHATLAWASFPCQDLSLAGKQRGLGGERSGSFWGFWRLMQGLEYEGRPTSLVVLENVVGTITTRAGEDFRVLLDTLVSAGYSVGPMVVNAAHFVPQSRPRLFIVAVRKSVDIPSHLRSYSPNRFLHPASLSSAFERMPAHIQQSWVWWNLSTPVCGPARLVDLVEENPDSVRWHNEQETDRLYELMPPLHREKVRQAQLAGKRMVGTLYRRIRSTDNGEKAQVAEVRFDGVSGCLRTGSGGSSRQFLIIVEGDRIRSRLLSTREAARLMGVPDSYQLPAAYNEAYHLIGDGLVVPVVSWLEEHLLRPLATKALRGVEGAICLDGITGSPVELPLQPTLFQRRAKRYDNA